MTFYPGAAFLRFYVILSQNFWDFKAQEYDFFDHFFAEIYATALHAVLSLLIRTYAIVLQLHPLFDYIVLIT